MAFPTYRPAEDYYRMKFEEERERMRATQVMAMPPFYRDPGYPLSFSTSSSPRTSTISPEEQLKNLKKSVEQIEAEPFESGARKRIEGKIGRLQSAGAVAQAIILEEELRTRDSLVRLKEWDYKLLTKKTIKSFQSDNKMTLTRDGLKVHIDLLDKYCGNPDVGEAKDRIMPDHILDKLEEAKTRELFDDYAVLWAGKVKDPLLLGIVSGCEDYFFIAEWGKDISFEQLTKGESVPSVPLTSLDAGGGVRAV